MIGGTRTRKYDCAKRDDRNEFIHPTFTRIISRSSSSSSSSSAAARAFVANTQRKAESAIFFASETAPTGLRQNSAFAYRAPGSNARATGVGNGNAVAAGPVGSDRYKNGLSLNTIIIRPKWTWEIHTHAPHHAARYSRPFKCMSITPPHLSSRAQS